MNPAYHSEEGMCLVCVSRDAESLEKDVGAYIYRCSICGAYELESGELLSPSSDAPTLNHWQLTELQRSVLSHRIREHSDAGNERSTFLVTASALADLRTDAALPSPGMQAVNAIRFIGDEVSKSGDPINGIPDRFHAVIGAKNRAAGDWILSELRKKSLVTILHRDQEFRANRSGPGQIVVPVSKHVNLSLDGWEQYEREKRGRVEGNYGFVAMKFGDRELDTFMSTVVKPRLEEAGFELVDMRDRAEAGVIDNIMRARIRDARFVIVDLTHDNRGAYWEAGYAEGLGKPVIYTCKRVKFEEASTHFDTNHCTTVQWTNQNDEGFCEELLATLKRSLVTRE